MADYDLSALWDEHCRHEFGTRDVDATMATMVSEPYVNHIPTITGGVGHDHLKRFYKYHFIDSNPADLELVPVSRTVGEDQVVDELLIKFTHDSEIDWMLPGIKPTGKKLRYRWSPSSTSSTASWRTSTSTGIRPRSWSRSACSTLRACR